MTIDCSLINDHVDDNLKRMKDLATFLSDFMLSLLKKREVEYLEEETYFCNEAFAIYERALMTDHIFEVLSSLIFTSFLPIMTIISYMDMDNVL